MDGVVDEVVDSTTTSNNTTNNTTNATSNHTTTTIILITALAAFCIQSEIAQSIQQASYYKPLFMLYIAHVSYSIILLLQYAYLRFTLTDGSVKSWSDYWARMNEMGQSVPGIMGLFHDTTSKYDLLSNNDEIITDNEDEDEDVEAAVEQSEQSEQPTTNRLFISACVLSFLFNTPSYFWYICLGNLPVADLTAIFNTASIFAYLFAIKLLKEPVKWMKILAVVVSVIGVVILVAGQRELDNSNGNNNSDKKVGAFWGYLLSMTSAVLYGLYDVLYKIALTPKQSTTPLHSPFQLSYFVTGLLGVATFITLTPILILTTLFNTSESILPLPSLQTFLGMLLVATFGIIFNSCFMLLLAVSSSPVIPAVGVMLTLPAVSIVDWIVEGVVIHLNEWIGGALICAGFLLLISQS